MRAIFLCAVLAVCSGYKFLVYSPLFGHSHNNYINKIADTLTEAGHDVTVIMPVMDRHLLNRTGLKMTKKAIIVDPDPRVDHIMKTTTMFSDLWSSDSSLIGFAKMVDTLSDMFGHTCEHLIQQKELLAKLKAEKFDAAIAEPFYYCGFGLLEHLGVKTVISAFSGANIGYVSYLIGEPSSVPSTQAAKPAQQQTIADKMKTIMGSITDWYMFSSIANAESQRLKKYYGEKYSGTAELIGQTSYSFVNSNPYIDFPRPTVSKTVLIGGITVDVNNIEKLDGEWNALLSKRPQTVLISFGTVAKSKDMPNEYKQQLLKVIESLPDVTFIWKYEVSTNMGAHLSNLHLSKWVPQKALLSDKRLSVFITHGGLASSTEVAYLGKPAIFIPLFADQPRNAAMIARHGTAIVLPKENMVSADKIRTAITTVLNDKKYEEKARILGEMLRNQPINPKDLVVKHAEFAARFGPIKNLDPPARHLSVVEYYLLDVFALLGGVLLLIFVSLVYLMETLGKLWRALGDGGDRRTTIVITTITVANIILSLGKIGRSYYDSSLSIFTSGLESFGDVFACFIIAYNRYLEQNSNPVEFPRGRETKALGYVTCAWVMIVLAMGSFIYDFESVFVKKVAPQLTLVDLCVMGGNILLKFFLWLICIGSKSTELKVLQMDQLNDILNNLITIVSVAATMYFYYLFDLAGAVIICCIIIRNWAKVMSKYSKRVHGRSVSPEVLSEIIEHASAHSHGKKIKETVAYYKGQSIVLEVSVFCKLTNYHEIAEEVRDHMLKFEDIHQVHVFPFDTRKISMEVAEEGLLQLQGIKAYSTDNISYVTADGESEPIQADGQHNAMIEPVDVNEQSLLNPEI